MKITPKFLIISCFNFLVFSVPLYFRFENEELFEFNKMILVYFVTVLIGLFWVSRMIIEKRLILKRTPLDYPIIFFVFSQFISTIFSIHPYTSWLGYYSRFHGGFLSTISYVVLFYAFVSTVKKKDLGSFFLSVFASGLIVSIYGILEHFGHSISCLLVPGQRSFGVDCWIQDVQSRVFASFGQPNWLAAYAITLVPLAFVAAIQKKLAVSKRILFTVTTTALFLVLLYTRSRSGLLGFGVGSLVFLIGFTLLLVKTKKQIIQKLSKSTVAVLISVILILALLNGTGFTPSLREVMSIAKNKELLTTETSIITTPTTTVDRLEQGGTDSGEIRKIVWTGALKVWQRYPVTGSGVETFAYSYYLDRTREHNDVSEWDFLYNKAHNEILNFMATTGTVGLLAYLSIFTVLSGISLKIIYKSEYTNTDKLISLALLAGQTALFISNFFGFSTVGVTLLMYLFFAVTSIIYVDEKKSINQEKKEIRTTYVIENTEQYFGLTLVSIIGLFLLFRIYNYWAADKAYAIGTNNFDAGNYQYGIQKQLEAINRSPNEALYYDTLSDNYAKLAVSLAAANESTVASQLAQESITASNKALNLNSKHLNFYKTRSRVMITLSELEESLINDAISTVQQAMSLAPTDPKLPYTLGVIEQSKGNIDSALVLYQQALALKPNYERALWKISEVYTQQGNTDQAKQALEFILNHITPGNEEVIKKIELLSK